MVPNHKKNDFFMVKTIENPPFSLLKSTMLRQARGAIGDRLESFIDTPQPGCF